MNAVSSIAAVPASVGVDHSRVFIREEFTPLFHTSGYALLPAAARLRYNQLHALYFNEQITFFEQEMLSPALVGLMNSELPADLAESVRLFHDEEQQHTAMFRSLNRQCAPAFYGEREYFFIRVPAPCRALLGQIASRPHVFPLLLWLALLQEERSLYYSKGCLDRAHELEPHFVAVHRSHLADEVGHIGWDGDLLDWLWPRSSSARRQGNVWLLNWAIREFFLLPKRSGVRVVQQLVREFPHLDACGLFRGMHELKSRPDYLRSLYSRQVTPRSFARFDAHPEFALLARTLPGYRPPGYSL